MLSDQDRRLLRRWQAEPDKGPKDLADTLGQTPTQVARRIGRLEEQGVIEAVETEIDWAALGYEVEVSLRITLDKTQARAFDDFTRGAREIPEVLEIQTFLGRVDVRLHVIARDMSDYQRLYRDRILTLPHIADIEALMQVARIKTSEGLPL